MITHGCKLEDMQIDEEADSDTDSTFTDEGMSSSSELLHADELLRQNMAEDFFMPECWSVQSQQECPHGGFCACAGADPDDAKIWGHVEPLGSSPTVGSDGNAKVRWFDIEDGPGLQKASEDTFWQKLAAGAEPIPESVQTPFRSLLDGTLYSSRRTTTNKQFGVDPGSNPVELQKVQTPGAALGSHPDKLQKVQTPGADSESDSDTPRKRRKFGTRIQVWNGTVERTKHGLSKADLKLNKHGRVVSATISQKRVEAQVGARLTKCRQNLGTQVERGCSLVNKDPLGKQLLQATLAEYHAVLKRPSPPKSEVLVRPPARDQATDSQQGAVVTF